VGPLDPGGNRGAGRHTVNQIRAARESWSLLRSESRADTYAAVAILAVVFGPVLYRVWKLSREGVHTENRRPSRGSLSGRGR
jgi:hypothetical protein